MSTIYVKPEERVLTSLDDSRGTCAMWLVIATEAALFLSLFCAYFLLGNNKDRWTIDQPPKLHFALINLGVLIVSSLVLIWGERQAIKQRNGAARICLLLVILCGLAFLALEAFEYLDHWKSLTPYSDSYGSIFYTITTLDAAHLIVGILIFFFVLFLPRYSAATGTPYRPYHVAAIYWHFVVILWIFIVGILYVIPNLVVYVH